MTNARKAAIAWLRTRARRAARTSLRARVLLSSYAALNLILFARVEPAVPKYVCLSLAIVGLLDGLRLSYLAGQKATVPRRVAEVQDAGPEVAAYLATYLLPLLAAPSPTTGDLIGYGVYGLVVILVSLRSNMAHVNPTLYLLGWQVSSVVFESGDKEYVVARTAPKQGETIYVAQLYGVLHRE